MKLQASGRRWSHNYICYNYGGHNCICGMYIGAVVQRGHNYTCHNYKGHNCIVMAVISGLCCSDGTDGSWNEKIRIVPTTTQGSVERFTKELFLSQSPSVAVAENERVIARQTPPHVCACVKSKSALYAHQDALPSLAPLYRIHKAYSIKCTACSVQHTAKTRSARIEVVCIPSCINQVRIALAHRHRTRTCAQVCM